jgi:hypothetical protein
MLDTNTRERIINLVHKQPCTVQEIAHALEKNWRTAESYVDRIALETGLIGTRTFRGGTRGALKIVYWRALDAGRGSAYQERLLARVLAGRRKEDFSPMDIYQFAAQKKATRVQGKAPVVDLSALRVGEELLILSGNLSWFDSAIEKELERLAARRVSTRILCRVDLTSSRSVARLLRLNDRAGWDAVAIRHCEQPLRGVIVDEKIAVLREAFSTATHPEVKKAFSIVYTIPDEHWAAWLRQVFWKLWESSVDARVRLDALESM